MGVTLRATHPSVQHINSTQKDHSFSAPKIPQFHTTNPSVQHTPQFHTENPSVPNPKLLSYRLKTAQFNTTLRQKIAEGYVELRGFRCETEGCAELRGFRVELMGFRCGTEGLRCRTEGLWVMKRCSHCVEAICWTEGPVWNWGVLFLKWSLFSHSTSLCRLTRNKLRTSFCT